LGRDTTASTALNSEFHTITCALQGLKPDSFQRLMRRLKPPPPKNLMLDVTEQKMTKTNGA
jgi:hypothetical protein